MKNEPHVELRLDESGYDLMESSWGGLSRTLSDHFWTLRNISSFETHPLGGRCHGVLIGEVNQRNVMASLHTEELKVSMQTSAISLVPNVP